MEPIEALKLLTDTPLTLVLLYLLIREQRDHAETRRARDADNRMYLEETRGLTVRVVTAVERLDLPGPL